MSLRDSDLPVKIWTSQRIAAVVALLGIAASAAMVLRFPPAQNTFYPRCPVHEYLRLQCPGCGATRALAALLHGQFAEAIQLNAFFVGLRPLAIVYATVSARRAWTTEAFRWPAVEPRATYALLAGALIFTVVRNL